MYDTHTAQRFSTVYGEAKGVCRHLWGLMSQMNMASARSGVFNRYVLDKWRMWLLKC